MLSILFTDASLLACMLRRFVRRDTEHSFVFEECFPASSSIMYRACRKIYRIIRVLMHARMYTVAVSSFRKNGPNSICF
jgi:hypothetical protein